MNHNRHHLAIVSGEAEIAAMASCEPEVKAADRDRNSPHMTNYRLMLQSFLTFRPREFIAREQDRG